MKAFALTEIGTVPQLVTVDDPVPGAGEVVVRVHAASVNGFDLSVAGGYLKDFMEHRFPVVIGKDFAGVVEAVGEGITAYSPGDRVFGVVTKPFLGDGSFGELVTVPTAIGIVKLPEGVSFEEGGALGLAGTAAADALASRDVSGQTVLVVGATGGVGAFATQLARNAGARVIATASTDEEKALVTAMGAEETVDYSGDIVAAVRQLHPEGVDVVLHFAGDPSMTSVVKKGGRFVSTRVMSAEQIPAGDYESVAIMANPAASTLETLAAAVSAKQLQVPIQQTFDLESVAQAFESFAAGTIGKISITVAR